jgi:uncharacterized protein YndB with AHSA1/START domain
MTDTPLDETIAAQIHAPVEVLLEHGESQWTLVMRRHFPHSPQKLWQMITDPERLARWSPVVPNRPLTEPGPATCREEADSDPLNAEVLIADAPRRLVHRWGSELLAWTINPVKGGATLELRHTLTDRSQASQFAAGWQVCLGRLAAEDDRIRRERVVGERARDYRCQELLERYETALTGTCPARGDLTCTVGVHNADGGTPSAAR